MSDEDSNAEEIKQEKPEEPGKLFFISHLNTYVGKTLLAENINSHLVKDVELASHHFVGTYKEDEPDGSGKVNACPD